MAYEKLLGNVVGKDGVTYVPKVENYFLSWINNDPERATEIEGSPVDLSPYIYVPEFEEECNLIYKLKKYNPITKTFLQVKDKQNEDIKIEMGSIKGEHGDNVIHIKVFDGTFDELKVLENKNSATIYYIKRENEDIYDGYVYNKDSNELIEIQSTLNLDNYYTINQIDNKVAEIITTQEQIISLLG